MSKIQVPFSVPGYPEFRFNLTLESNSVEAHSLMDSGDFKSHVEDIMRSQSRDPRLLMTFERCAAECKEKHK